MGTYRQTQVTGNMVTYSNVTDFTDSIREVVNRNSKRISQYSLMNAATTISLNRRRILNPLQEGCDPCSAAPPVYEFLKAEFHFSGSTEASAAGLAIINDTIKLALQFRADYMAGFVTSGSTIILDGTLPEL